MSSHILVVEDSPDYRELYKRMLAALKVSCDQTSRADEAIRFCQDQKYDLIISDLVLNDGTGFELFAQLMKRGYQPEQFILISGGIQIQGRETLSLAQEMGVTYIQKPFAYHELVLLIKARLQTIKSSL